MGGRLNDTWYGSSNGTPSVSCADSSPSGGAKGRRTLRVREKMMNKGEMIWKRK